LDEVTAYLTTGYQNRISLTLSEFVFRKFVEKSKIKIKIQKSKSKFVVSNIEKGREIHKNAIKNGLKFPISLGKSD